MGVDACAFMPNRKRSDILDLIKAFDLNASIRSKDSDVISSSFDFDLFGNNRIMRSSEIIINKKKADEIEKLYKTNKDKYKIDLFRYSDSEHFISFGIPNNTSGISLSLGGNEQAVEIMRIICLYFGGYFDENDCDDGGYEYLDKDWSKIITIVFSGKLGVY